MEVIHLPQRSEVVKTISTPGTDTNVCFQQLLTIAVNPPALLTIIRTKSYYFTVFKVSGICVAHPGGKMVSLSHQPFSLTTIT